MTSAVRSGILYVCENGDNRVISKRIIAVDATMKPFDGIPEFIAVAETEGFSAAARKLGISTSKVSRQVSALERRLDVQLVARTTRRVRLDRCRSRILPPVLSGNPIVRRGKSRIIGPNGRTRGAPEDIIGRPLRPALCGPGIGRPCPRESQAQRGRRFQRPDRRFHR